MVSVLKVVVLERIRGKNNKKMKRILFKKTKRENKIAKYYNKIRNNKKKYM